MTGAFKRPGVRGAVVGGLLGYAVGSLVVGGIALACALLIPVDPAPGHEHRHGPDPVGAVLGLSYYFMVGAVRLLAVLFWGTIGGAVGAIIGAIRGAARARRATAKAAVPVSPDDEIAALKARIEDLERSRADGP